MRKVASADKILFWTVCGLVFSGLFILFSASMGLLARSKGANFSDTIFQQIIFGFLFGFVLLLIATRINYKIFAKFALPFFIFGLFLSLLVFVPGLGFSHGGATRWLDLGPLSFQPAEILKFSLIVYLVALLSSKKRDIRDFWHGFVPYMCAAAAASFVLVLQKDMGTMGVVAASVMGLFFLGGGRFKHFLLTIAVAGVALVALVYFEPYRMERMTVFLNPSHDPQGSGYQLRQSLIAIGSGGIFGRGFGMSLQKFNYLPEPIGDSVFAVFAEEFGLIGGLFFIGLFLFFTHRGFSVSARAPDDFGRLLGVGIVIMITTQSFINIAAMTGIFPLTGIPLIFVSKGGTAMMIALAEIGVLLSISKLRKK